ncbi:MAG: hypothetical protein K6C11_00655 [Bacilli bacterium]|nr:hypothetical protein [Bacilli bacterium]
MCGILNSNDLVDYMNDDESEYTDEELDNLGLNEEEKDLVKNEGWSPFDFNDDEDEEAEDDDYYNDDE